MRNYFKYLNDPKLSNSRKLVWGTVLGTTILVGALAFRTYVAPRMMQAGEIAQKRETERLYATYDANSNGTIEADELWVMRKGEHW
jgi:hypothetical protein